MRLFSFMFTLLLSYSAAAVELPQESRVPGGIALIPLTGLDSATAPSAWYKGNRVMVLPTTETTFAQQASWVAVIGIPLSAKATKDQLMKADGKSFPFQIRDKEYEEQRLTVTNKRHVNPNKQDLARYKREKTEMVAAFKSWSTPAIDSVSFNLPATGRFSSPFGLKRFFNDQPRNPHSGLDIAGGQGGAISAPAPGKVVAVGEYFFNGNTVIIDHGYGLTTMYCHMSRIDVKIGDQLNTGDSIGAIGKTGRVTGPHLHWSVSLNNTRVDPLLFVKQ
ncbi:peptidoglycan DD-metalloendopeptidase family protein [Amphritea pacifica]|uniref:Peptidoglycan DD-metalloendopeptidase family protein n=1 Tax=Amphritea pacifica TaxID=2811233 RepID=A0ABS2WE49_9GAMM|nr:peptidoglycan DD-metalloendopeptidase family protein [Amphritea pacifica]MBN0989772.1 peptidoglycan DD-metalloendopeptidase family protein [Amphritea pacifica]